MRKSAMFAAFVLSLPATGVRADTSPLTAATVGEFLTACAGDRFGCASAIGAVLIARANLDAASRVCIASPDYTDAVPKWLAAHPETAALSRDDGILLALKTLYPC